MSKRADYLPDSSVPTRSSKKDAEALVQQALDMVGENGLREIIMGLARSQLTMAISLLYSDSWWITRLTSAIDAPQSVNIALLTKMIDKMIPSIGAVKAQVDQPDQLVIQYERPEDEVVDEALS